MTTIITLTCPTDDVDALIVALLTTAARMSEGGPDYAKGRVLNNHGEPIAAVAVRVDQ